jgi:hypothetical protein
MANTTDVEVRQPQIAGAGRGLFAKRAFRPGDIVVSIPRPLVAEVHDEQRATTCAWCFLHAPADQMGRMRAASMGSPSANLELKGCTGCNMAKYCSKTCQTKAWKADHKYECKILREEPHFVEPCRIVAKLLGRLKKDDQALKETLQYSFKKADVQRYEPVHCARLVEAAKDAANACGFALSGDGKRSERLTSAVMLNSLSLFDPLGNVKLGCAFDPLLCTVNHSCEANTSFVFNNP